MAGDVSPVAMFVLEFLLVIFQQFLNRFQFFRPSSCRTKQLFHRPSNGSTSLVSVCSTSREESGKRKSETRETTSSCWRSWSRSCSTKSLRRVPKNAWMTSEPTWTWTWPRWGSRSRLTAPSCGGRKQQIFFKSRNPSQLKLNDTWKRSPLLF